MVNLKTARSKEQLIQSFFEKRFGTDTLCLANSTFHTQNPVGVVDRQL